MSRNSNSRQEAQSRANALLKKIRLKGAKTKVWNNLGWWYSIEANGWTVRENEEGTYRCLIQPSYTFWVPKYKSFKDPNRAIAHAMKYAQDVCDQYQHYLNIARNSIYSKKKIVYS